jgi:hypothetical protein
MAEDKKIKLSFAVDPKGLQDARNALKALTNDVKALIEQMGRAGTGLQSLMGGLSGKTGGIKASQESIKMPAVGGIGAGITKDAQALSQVSRAGTQAIDGLTRSLKSNFSGQIADIERLKNQLNSLEKVYEKISRIASNPEASANVRRKATSALVQKDLERAILGQQIAGHFAAREGLDGGSPFAEPPPLTPPAPGTTGGGRFPIRAGLGGMLRWAAGPAAGAAVATALGTVGAGFSWTSSAETTAARLGLSEPLLQNSVNARIGRSIGGMGMAIRGGDLGLAIAARQVFGGGLANRAFGTTEGDLNRIRLAEDASGNSTTLGAIGAKGKDWAGRKLSWAVGGVASGADSAASRQLNIKMAEMKAEEAEQLAQAAQNQKDANLKYSTMANELYSGAFGDMAMARTGGIGMGYNKYAKAFHKMNPKALSTQLDFARYAGNSAAAGTTIDDFKARAEAAGYSGAEWAGAMRQLGGIAGWGLRGAGPKMLSAQLGGFSAANQVYGAGAQFGNLGLFNTAQRGMGAGGLDATAGSQIAAAVAQHMMGGNFAGAGGNNVMMGIMSAALTGTPGGDMRAARMAAAGLSEYGRNAAGATDGLQMGINTLAAGASGVKGFYARKMLMNMDPAQMIEALRGGSVPEYLKDAGVDIGNLERYNSFRNQYAFTRYLDKEGGGSRVGQAVAGVKSAGGLREYLHGRLRGVTKPSDRRGIIQAELEKLGTARMLTEGGTREANIGALMAEVATDKSLAPDLKGKGAWAPKLDGHLKEIANAEAAKQKELSNFAANFAGSLKEAIGQMPSLQKAFANMSSSLQKESADFNLAVRMMTEAVMDYIRTTNPAKYAELVKQQKAAEMAMKIKAVPLPATRKPLVPGLGATMEAATSVSATAQWFDEILPVKRGSGE